MLTAVLAGLVLAIIPAYAFAQDVSAIVGALCSDNGSLIVEILAGVGTAGILANARGLLLKSVKTAWIVPVLDLLGANIWKLVENWAQSRKVPVFVAVLALPLALGACKLAADVESYGKDLVSGAPADTLTADQATIAAQVAAYNAQFKTTALSAGSSALAIGKSACGYAAELDGLFKVVAPVAIAAGAADPGVAVTEAGVFLGVGAACKVIDLPAGTDVATAAASVVAALPAIQSAVATVSPAAAAAATAPVTPPPATPAAS